jgi:anti-sigma regulatory factor (Ser/Thr protein kinase)
MIKSPTSPAFHGVKLDATVQKNAETVRLEERTRIARELHDTLLQTFQSASLYLGAALHGVPEDLPVRSQLDRTLEIMRQGITEGRNAIRALRSSGLHASDLILALSQVPGSSEPQSDIDFRVTVTGRPMQLPPEIQHQVHRIGREALTNAFCHSGARRVDLAFQFSNNRLTVRIRDNGRGIDPRTLKQGRDGHWGLTTMRERATAIGALLKIVSIATGGTEIELSIPISLNLEYSLPPCRRSLRVTGDGRSVFTPPAPTLQAGSPPENCLQSVAIYLNRRHEDLPPSGGSTIAEIKACNNHQSSTPRAAKDSIRRNRGRTRTSSLILGRL